MKSNSQKTAYKVERSWTAHTGDVHGAEEARVATTIDGERKLDDRCATGKVVLETLVLDITWSRQCETGGINADVLRELGAVERQTLPKLIDWGFETR